MGNRVNLVAGIGTMLTAFIAANPTLLKRYFTARPTSLVTDWPCAYIDLRATRVGYANGLRDTVFTPSIVFVDGDFDPQATANRIDALVDAFTNHLDSYARLVTGTAWSDGSWAEERIPLSDETVAAGVRWTFGDITFKEGRN